MLQKRGYPPPHRDDGNWLPASATPEFGEIFEKLMLRLRRQWQVVAAGAVLALAIGAAYVLTAVPLYTSFVDILLQPSSSKLLDDFTEEVNPTDETAILSQVELLQSERIAARVVDTLALHEDAAFLASASTPLTRLRALVRSVADVGTMLSDAPRRSEAEIRRDAAILKVLDNVSVQRIEKSYVLRVQYTSPFPAKAGAIARAYGEAYLADQLDAKYAATRSASDWLQQRIEELRVLALQSDLAVQKFRADNGLIATSGVLVSERTLSQLNTSLVEARSETSRTKAQLDRINTIIASGSPDELVTDALNSPLINKLRGEYLERSKLVQEIIDRLGEDHTSVARLNAEREEYRRQIFAELGRIAESYQSEYNVALANERSIQEQVDSATGVTAASNETMVQLRELERKAETYRTLYETFLQRYQEAVQQENFPVTGTRVINEARVPSVPSHPRKVLVLALSVILGVAAGAGVAAIREYRDRFFRTSDDVKEELGLEYLGATPIIAGSDVPVPDEGATVHPRFLHKTNSVSSIAVDHPMSQFAETLRSARFAADMAIGRHRPKTIGVISILPGEGKSTVSINFAEMLASYGTRTLLVDGDLRRPGLTWATARHARAGLVEAILERRPLSELVLQSRQTRLHVLPAVVNQPIPHTSSMLASAGMAAMLEEARGIYETIVVDLPPIAPVVDARAVAAEIDAFILVVEWGKTARKAVRTVLEGEPQIRDRCLGVILNKVDRDKMKLYSDHGSSEYYHSTYSGYYDQTRAA